LVSAAAAVVVVVVVVVVLVVQVRVGVIVVVGVGLVGVVLVVVVVVVVVVLTASLVSNPYNNFHCLILDQPFCIHTHMYCMSDCVRLPLNMAFLVMH